MVDVGGKDASSREAVAEARVVFPEAIWAAVLSGELPKGSLVETARLAGIQAAKRTAEWIPLCHPLSLDLVEVEAEWDEASWSLVLRCRASAHARTGVEMEALVGATAAALTAYDMAKGLDKGILLREVRLLRKSGGKSGLWEAQ